MKLMILPDPHAHPNYDNERFTSLNRFIKKEKPDKLICLGDFADMPSLSSYDKGKKSFEGRRYKKDIGSAIDAQERLFRGLDIDAVMLLGNHEDRINRAVNESPELSGMVDIDNLNYSDYWDVKPYQATYKFKGISFSHHFVSGIAGRPIGGEHIAASLCNKLHTSAVVGHSHVFNHAERTKPDGVKIFGLSAGCFSHPKQVEGWNYATHHLWWRGIVILEDVSQGYYDEIRAITLRKLMR